MVISCVVQVLSCTDQSHLIDAVAMRQMAHASEIMQGKWAEEVGRADPIVIDAQQPEITDVVSIPERRSTKRVHEEDMASLHAAADAVSGTAHASCRTSKRRRVDGSPLAEESDADLVAKYRFLKKHIYSMADQLESRSESERWCLGRLLKQTFSEKLCLYNQVRRELDARGIDFNSTSKWPEVYCN